jgi:hypothetical protein
VSSQPPLASMHVTCAACCGFGGCIAHLLFAWLACALWFCRGQGHGFQNPGAQCVDSLSESVLSEEQVA